MWEHYGSTVTWSLWLALLCVAGNLLIGVPCAYALARSRSRAARLFEELLTLPVAVPGLASALALILAYGSLQGFRQSFAFILVGHMVFTLPFMVRTVGAAFRKDELRSLEEAARSLGASFSQRFLGVLVPAVLPAIVAGSLMVFTLSVGEFNLTWMLHTPLTRTLPVGLADSYASMRIEIGSAYTLVFLIVILPVLWGLQAAGTFIEKTPWHLNSNARAWTSSAARRPMPAARAACSPPTWPWSRARCWRCWAPRAAARPRCCA